MAYQYLPVKTAERYCRDIFMKMGFSDEDSKFITDVLITADLYGIESHGIQRMIRYYKAMEEGFISPSANPEIVFETPLTAVLDATKSMGQIAARTGMNMAIDKAGKSGFGMITVRNSNHFGIAGYYASMAADADMLGICMSNTEAIAVPTFGRKAMLGTNPIAVCMPAEPVNFWYDAATTVVTRGKLEVYTKKGEQLYPGWASDENGHKCTDAQKVINNISGKKGGGIFPLGGDCVDNGSHKGYGLGIIVELFTSIFSGGTTSPHVKNSGNADTSFCFCAIDYGAFGNKEEIRQRISALLQELRDSPRADGCERIYTHGEKEAESLKEIIKSGIPVNEKTIDELMFIGKSLGVAYVNR